MAVSPNSKGELETSFIKTPIECLQWSYRLPLILQEIASCDPDIICLEEVDRFNDLVIDGYDKIFMPKVNSPCTNFQPNNGPDGSAILFKTSKVNLLDRRDVVLQDESNKPTSQVGLLAKFSIVQDGGMICVGVVHLKAKSGFEKLRHAQGLSLFRSLQEFVPSPKECSFVICGDFNAVPSEDVCTVFRSLEGGVIQSAYARYTGSDPEFTTVKCRAAGLSKYTGDYIFYNSDKLLVTQLYDLMTEQDIGTDTGLPNRNYPSDHMALCASFILKK